MVRGRNRETSQKTIAVIWAGGDGGFGPGPLRQKWLTSGRSGCSLKAERMGPADGLVVGRSQ